MNTIWCSSHRFIWASDRIHSIKYPAILVKPNIPRVFHIYPSHFTTWSEGAMNAMKFVIWDCVALPWIDAHLFCTFTFQSFYSREERKNISACLNCVIFCCEEYSVCNPYSIGCKEYTICNPYSIGCKEYTICNQYSIGCKEYTICNPYCIGCKEYTIWNQYSIGCNQYPYFTLNKITGKNISKKYPPIPRNASENELQATWLPLWQILPLPATGASQQDIRGIRKANNVDVIYLDFAKTFDKVGYGILLNKLKKIGIYCKIGVWIHNFLTNRQQCVAANGTTSSED